MQGRKQQSIGELFMAHVLMKNRNGLVVDTRLTKSTGKAEIGRDLLTSPVETSDSGMYSLRSGF